MLVYGSGLRIEEVANLRIEDIDSKNMRIFVREEKGNKERYTILPKQSLEMLRRYWSEYRQHRRRGRIFLSELVKAITAGVLREHYRKYRRKAKINEKATIHTINWVIKDIELKDSLMISSESYLAGLLSYEEESIEIENVKNYINIKALERYSHTAGIVNEIDVYNDNAKVIIKDYTNFVPMEYAIINNLYIEECDNSEATIENCYNTNDYATNNVGGLIGEITAYVYTDEQKEKIVQVKNCYNTGNITSSGIYAPVISGINFYGKSQICVENCYNTGNINCTRSNGNTRVGGVVGTIYCEGPVDNDKKYGVIVKNCYNTGNIYGREYIGGIVGDAELTNYDENFEILGLWIQNCYNSGEISGQESVGGIAGEFVGSAIIENCYNVGKIEATQNAGGIAGYVFYCIENNPGISSYVGLE